MVKGMCCAVPSEGDLWSRMRVFGARISRVMGVCRVADVEAGRDRAVEEDEDAVDGNEGGCQSGRPCFMIYIESETDLAQLQMRLWK